MVFHHLWMNLVAFPEPPQVVTSEGDPLMARLLAPGRGRTPYSASA